MQVEAFLRQEWKDMGRWLVLHDKLTQSWMKYVMPVAPLPTQAEDKTCNRTSII